MRGLAYTSRIHKTKNDNNKMKRRDFLKTTAVGTAAFSLLGNSVDAAEPGELAPSASQRQIPPLNRRWLYSEKSSADAMKSSFNDRSWKSITLPHTNKMLPMNGFD